MKTTKLKKEDYHEVFVRYIKLTEKQEELLKQIDKDFIYKENDKEQKGEKNNEYQFNILEYNNSTGFFDNCYRYILRFEKTKYSRDFIENYLKDILKEEIESIGWNGKEETKKLSIRLKGNETKINSKLSYYDIKNYPIQYPISILSYGRYNENKNRQN